MARRQNGMPTGRIELLNWMNEFLETDYTKVEQACDGIPFAQIIDCASGMRMPLQKFNFASRNGEEHSRNLTVLQQEFKKLSIDHPVPVAKLANGRFQDNNEFLLWCFAYLHNCCDDPQSYPAARRRQEALQKQVRGRSRGTLPPPHVKPELASGIDLDAPSERSPVTMLDPPIGRQQPQHQQPPATSHYDPTTYQSPHQMPPPALDDFEGGEDLQQDIDVLQLSLQLSEDLQRAKVEQSQKKKEIESHIKDRYSMWQQLRTVCFSLIFTF